MKTGLHEVNMQVQWKEEGVGHNTEWEEMYQRTIKYAKWLENFPDGHEICVPNDY
jgi:hypothetical protein